MTFTENQWEALCSLRRIYGNRKESATTRALREVLVDGKEPLEVAKRYGLTHQCVYNAMSRSRTVIETAKVLAEAPEL